MFQQQRFHDINSRVKIIEISLVSFAVLATRDTWTADELSGLPSVSKALSRLVSIPIPNDPFSFDVAQSRLTEGRRLGLGKPERSMVFYGTPFEVSVRLNAQFSRLHKYEPYWSKPVCSLIMISCVPRLYHLVHRTHGPMI